MALVLETNRRIVAAKDPVHKHLIEQRQLDPSTLKVLTKIENSWQQMEAQIRAVSRLFAL